MTLHSHVWTGMLKSQTQLATRMHASYAASQTMEPTVVPSYESLLEMVAVCEAVDLSVKASTFSGMPSSPELP